MSQTVVSRSAANESAEFDVIVVGSGAGAMTGAYTAAVLGLQVLVIEKTEHLGGTAAYAGAAMWFPGNHVLARGGVEDSVEAGLKYLRATVGDRTPIELQEAYVRTGPDVVKFLDESGAVAFENMGFPDYFDAPGRCRPAGRAICPAVIEGARLGGLLDLLRPTTEADKYGQDIPRDTLTGGQSLIGQFMLAVRDTGNVEIRTEVPMESLIVEDGTVVGVRACGEKIRAKHAVILAAGGYDSNARLRQDYHGLPTARWTSAPAGSNTGDALASVEAVGAAVDLLEESWWTPGVLYPSGYAAFLPIVRGGFFVGPDGQRFLNESLPYHRLGRELLKKMRELGNDTEFWWVFDSHTPSVPGVSIPTPDPEEFRGTPYWRSADTIEGLAERIGVPADALRETLDRYNKYTAEGIDPDFHRGEDDYDRWFGQGDGPNHVLVQVDQPPFNAVRVVLSDLGTKGGARTTTEAQVIDVHGKPVPGLYAVGGSAASVSGEVYPGPGVPIGSSMALAYRAAHAIQAAALKATSQG